MCQSDQGHRDCGHPWQTIRIEIGHNEIGDADEFETSLPPDLAEVFEQLSFPPPKPSHGRTNS